MEKVSEFSKWVKDYADTLMQYALQRFNDRCLCEDIVQDTFVKAWKTMDNYRAEVSVKNWLFIILKSRIIDQHRKHAKDKLISLLADDHYFFDEQEHWKELAYPKDWTVATTDPTKQKEFEKVLGQCSSRLKPIQQTVFSMKYIDDYDSEEICRLLNITEANYWVIVHRAKVQLRHCLQQHWY